MRRTVQGIVLREINYKEADKILTVLTREEGKLTLTGRVDAAAYGTERRARSSFFRRALGQ